MWGKSIYFSCFFFKGNLWLIWKPTLTNINILADERITFYVVTINFSFENSMICVYIFNWLDFIQCYLICQSLSSYWESLICLTVTERAPIPSTQTDLGWQLWGINTPTSIHPNPTPPTPQKVVLTPLPCHSPKTMFHPFLLNPTSHKMSHSPHSPKIMSHSSPPTKNVSATQNNGLSTPIHLKCSAHPQP